MLSAALLFVAAAQDARSVEVHFKSHDGHEMFGKLVTPAGRGPFPVVIYVQTAEGMTVDMKRPLGGERTFNYFDLYRSKLPEMGVAFFSYEGRGVSMGDSPPRFETIDRAAYDTSTLQNKVYDVISALASVRGRSDIDSSRVYLMGASEGTLLAAEAAATVPELFAGLVLYGVMSSNMRYTFDYIMTDGAFLVYRQVFDADKDGTISKAEFEADPAKYRANTLGGAEFSVFDKDGDGRFTSDEMRSLTKPYTDAIDQENFAVLDAWAASAAAVATPKGWFKDHFAHKPIWSFLQELDVPVGLFHGDLDTSVPIEGLKLMESKAKAAGKTKMEFHYFTGVGHTIGVERYFVNGTVPAGHTAIFDFIKKVVSRP
ncbi:MAG: prolyl oligopeptidase family serine peptidase [Fimbriimonadaceae bacterium]